MKPQDYVALEKAPRLETQRTNYDYRGAGQAGPEVDLSTFQPGDVIQTEGANVRIRWNGVPAVTLKPGFDNGRSAGRKGPVLVPQGPQGVSVRRNMEAAEGHSPLWFLDMVPNKKPWDYKQLDRKFEPFGNFNYGAAGRASGLAPDVLLRGAGWAQRRATTSHPSFGSPYLGTGSYGDDPVDQFWIEQGARYRR